MNFFAGRNSTIVKKIDETQYQTKIPVGNFPPVK
jgi:hypothetical protein